MTSSEERNASSESDLAREPDIDASVASSDVTGTRPLTDDDTMFDWQRIILLRAEIERLTKIIHEGVRDPPYNESQEQSLQPEPGPNAKEKPPSQGG